MSDRGWRQRAADMRAALPTTWYAFFARFPRPQPVQLAAWQPIIEGRDCVVCSPTASGKTEAVVAPLVERHLAQAAGGLPRLLVVSPTRALVNDLVRRLREPLARLELVVHRRTGDHAVLDKDRPPQVLVTTPESFDSLLVRHPSFLRQVRAVVLDELHILDGTVRGDQLRFLLARLRGPGRLVQCVASSATIDDAQGLAQRYLREAEQVVVEGSKEIDCRLVPCGGPAGLVEILNQVWGPGKEQFRKILVFLGSRADVEQVAGLMHATSRLRSRTYAHHGSLARAERERVEERFAADPSAICCATMTLELGIDIGDVDLVVLASPPGSVASLLQRIGRGSRRAERSVVLACYRNSGDLIRFRHLVELGRRGDLCAEPYQLRPSVLVQQAGSLLIQSRDRWLSAEALHSRLPAGLGDEYSRDDLAELLAGLARNDWLAVGRGERFLAGERLLQAFDRGELHGNLDRELRTVEVVEESTGRRIGHVVREPAADSRLAIGGRSRQVLRETDETVWVTESADGDAGSSFAPRGRQTISAELARSLARSLEVADDHLLVAETGQGIGVFHFQGSLAGVLLARHLKKQHKWPVVRGTALALILDSLPPGDRPPAISSAALAAEVEPLARSLTRLAAAGRYQQDLPEAWQLRFLRRVIRCERIAAEWSRSNFAVPPNADLAHVLAELAAVR